MKKVLLLSDRGTKQTIQKLGLESQQLIGRGMFSLVYTNKNPRRVTKLSASACQLESLRWCLKGSHFPHLKDDQGMVGEQYTLSRNLYLYETDRLKPLSAAPIEIRREADRLMDKLTDLSCKYKYSSRRSKLDLSALILSELSKDKSLSLSIRRALVKLEEFTHLFNDVGLDFHRANLMLRGKDELVFNDVLVQISELRH